jgi:cytochrome c peroxidase
MNYRVGLGSRGSKWLLAVQTAVALLAGASAQGGDLASDVAAAAPRLGFAPRAYGRYPTVPQLTGLGRKIFFDAGLSASGKLACASCHDPAHGFAPPNARPVQLGGADMRQAGTRNAPSLKYLEITIAFTQHFIDDDDGHGEDAGPTGGLTWDGRANSPREQALIPLMAAHEMGNTGAAELAARVSRAAYAGEFRKAFSAPGADVFADPPQVVGWLAAALEIFQQNPAQFYPFTSKYDAFLRGEVKLSDPEMRGLAVFNDPGRGNCTSCHPSGRKSNGSLPLFTDAGYAAIGVPRNPRIPANRDPAHYDLGLCGPDRQDFTDQAGYCGFFKVPSLRNAALRQSFFHNGAVHSLEEAVRFYAERDTHLERWYSRGAEGQPVAFDDLPPELRKNVNQEPPFGVEASGKPRLTDADVRDIVAFLNTLTDGYRVPAKRKTAAGAQPGSKVSTRD